MHLVQKSRNFLSDWLMTRRVNPSSQVPGTYSGVLLLVPGLTLFLILLQTSNMYTKYLSCAHDSFNNKYNIWNTLCISFLARWLITWCLLSHQSLQQSQPIAVFTDMSPRTSPRPYRELKEMRFTLRAVTLQRLNFSYPLMHLNEVCIKIYNMASSIMKIF